VGMRKVGMPNPESSDGNFVVACVDRLEEDQGRGDFSIWARILEF